MDYVRHFFDVFEIPYEGSPNWPDDATIGLRVGLVAEELQEVVEAIKNKDKENLLKELTDLQYVLDGLYLTFGMDRLKILAMREVHKSNLSKLGPGNTVIRNPAGKVLKGRGYKPAKLDWLVGEPKK
jgi:predicted HAD superfamily Cof-like phosphohydrolase